MVITQRTPDYPPKESIVREITRHAAHNVALLSVRSTCVGHSARRQAKSPSSGASHQTCYDRHLGFVMLAHQFVIQLQELQLLVHVIPHTNSFGLPANNGNVGAVSLALP